MASWSTHVVRISFLVAFIILFAVVADASVTWRRVSRPTSKPRESTFESSTTSIVKSSTRSPITWKRSTIARRSTDAAEKRAREEELDEANSSQEEQITDQETDSEVRPLVPGSRPGFWFDSSRRKKPASLLRPGARRNSLFPTRSSTITTVTPTTVSIAPLTVIPRTPPSVSKFNSKNSGSRNSSRSRSTSSPIAFRKRIRTTRVPRQSSTANPTEIENKINEAFMESYEETENELTENGNETEDHLKDNEAEVEDVKPVRPKLGLRRRGFNSTRLSWTRQNSRKSSKTTVTPTQLTTTSSSTSVSAKDNGRFSHKTTTFPKTRTRSKTRTPFAPEVTWSRKRKTTAKPTSTAMDITSSEDVSLSQYESEDNDDSKSSKKNHPSNEHDDDMDSFTETSTQLVNDFGLREDSLELRKPKLKTTVEPFYITRDYGRIATALPEIRNNKEHRRNTTQDFKADEELIPTATTKLTTEKIYVVPTTRGTRKNKKRIKAKTTEAPKLTTTVKENIEYFDQEYEYETAGIDTSVENENSFELRNSTTDSLSENIDKEENSFQKLEVDPEDATTTTTIRPVTLPSFSTIDPNSNSYVVWSMGNGGSGWSYQKHGGQVKWSAQNSEAEGDNWSVVGREEDDNIQAGLNHQWKPIRNSTAAGQQKKEKSSKIKEKISIPAANPQWSSSAVSYMPQLSFKNETLLNFKMHEVAGLPYQIMNDSVSQYPPSLDYFGIKSTPSDNVTSFANAVPQTFNQQPRPASFVSQTPSSIAPTLENEFNEQVEGIINQYPIVPNYPYIAEIRETYKNLPNTAVNNAPTTKFFELQNYVTMTMDENMEKEPTTPAPIQQAAQFIKDPQSYSYPQADAAANFNGNLGKGILIPDTTPAVISTPHPSYLSRLPPELAKAVVEAKKWQVVGSGGDEGWSLLNEDGLLEWKIHNVDGQWRVSSAEQLKEGQVPPQLTESKMRTNDGIGDDNTNAESYGYNNGKNYQDLPKIWTLEDDYAKWRAVSAERGSPGDISSEETSKPSQEYGYDSREYYSDYYSDEDYYNPGIVNEEVASYNSNEDYGSRPLWGDGENQMIYSPPKEDYPQFSRNIEVANSREDAIEAWKSLVAQQGHWKLSESVNEGFKEYPSYKMPASQHALRNADRRISTLPPRPEVGLTKQRNFQETGDRKYESLRRDVQGQHVNQGNGQLEEVKYSVRDLEDKINHELQEATKVNEKHIVESPMQKRGHQRNVKPKDTNFSSVRHRSKHSRPKNKTRDPNYESIIESLVQKYKYQERRQPEESFHHMMTRHENESKQQINKLIEAITQNHGYTSENIGENYNERNQAEAVHLQAGRRTNEGREKYDNLQEDVYESNIQKNDQQYMNTKEDYFHANTQNYAEKEERNTEGIPEPRIRIRGNDHSKIESLINKLESVQRESKGRAVIDLTELLKHIKYRRNTTSVATQNSGSDANNPLRRSDSYHSLSVKHRNTIHNFPTRVEEKEPQENHQNVPKYMHYRLETDTSDDIRDRISSRTDYVENNEHLRTVVKPQNYRNHNLGQTNNQNQKMKFAVRSNNQSIESQQIKQNIQLDPNARMYPPARPTQQYRRERPSTTENEEKNTQKRERYTVSQSAHPRNSYKPEETDKLKIPDSSSSEEIIVDLRDSKRNKSVSTRKQRRPSRRRSRRPNHPQPIVLKGETEVKDEEDGSRKNRKIIVIDYAGIQKKKSSVDKKDLELIIRNVKHRRSELSEKP